MFIRGLAVVFFVAFLSLGGQVLGLIGEHGILPASRFLDEASNHFDASRFYLFPTLFWLNSSDSVLQACCWTGVGLSVLLFINIAPALLCAALTLLYLSLVTAGQDFLSFQWDCLLIETGTLATLIAPAKWNPGFLSFPLYSAFGLFLLRWLLFRFILLCGLVKLLSGDQTWHQLKALSYHFETQPLPTQWSYYIHHFPPFILYAACATVLAIEILAPFLIWGPRPFRRIAFVLIVGLQLSIMLSGNYGFFNWLSIVLCFPLLDDALFGCLLPDRLDSELLREVRVVKPTLGRQIAVYGIGTMLFFCSLVVTFESIAGTERVPRGIQLLTAIPSQWRVANGYGVFAVMTTSRDEIIIEGSNDGENWIPYELPYKPGDPYRSPTFVAPLQPRLDWQLWFAALAGYERSPWFQSLLMEILQNSEAVKRLFLKNPFPDQAPRYIRAQLYEYHFADRAEHRATRAWWHRAYIGAYSPTLTLQNKSSEGS